MNATLEDISMCIYMGRVPNCWSMLSPQTYKSLACYLKHLTKRSLQYSNWVNMNIIVYRIHLNKKSQLL